MVPSSVITIAADGEHLTCSGFSISEIICLGNFEFITNYFGGLSLSPRRGDSSTAFMGSTHSGTPSSRRAIREDSAEGFLMTSSGEGGFGLPSPKRRGTGAPPAPVTTTPWMENAPVTQAAMTIPPWTTVLWPDTSIPFEQCHTHQGAASVGPCSATHR
jgi:hypothetical protein